MAQLPTGTVTFFFTDIEGSTRLLHRVGEDAFIALLGQHHRILRDAIARHDGVEVATEGDAFFAVFPDAPNAVATALDAQIGLSGHSWPDGGAVRVRMGLHSAPGRRGGDNYAGLAVHQAARVSSAAHGGQVLASATTVSTCGQLGEGASWRPLGRHRLKDLGEAMELFQLVHRDLKAEFPPLRSLEEVANNFPVQLSSFLGPAEELALGEKILSATRFLSMTGAGGTGKTRVAYQLAAEQLAQFPDGVWVAELAPVSDPRLVPGVLMRAVGLRDQPGHSATETVVEFLASRQSLVVLDNCEHVIDACAALVTALLGGCRQLRVLATSREPLRVHGESVWVLEPLALPEPGETRLEVLATTDAVALFCERAAEAKIGFSLDADNAAYVRGICEHLEGIPLAIELAAARVRTLPLGEISKRLEQNLDLLSKGPRDALERQVSLRATINWSHDLLSPDEQVLFRRVGVFAGGFSLQSAEGVCAGELLEVGRVLDSLDGLVDKSLVALGADAAGEGRYRLLEPIRAYATERLDKAGELPTVSARHAVFFGQLATQCALAESGTSFDRLALDHANVLAALEYLSGVSEPIMHGQLAIDMWKFWDWRGHWRLGSREEPVRYLARSDADLQLKVHCTRYLGNFSFQLGDYAESKARHEEALSIARKIRDRRGEATCLRNLGNVTTFLGELAGASACYEEALSIARQIGERTLEGRCAGGLGLAALYLGRYKQARTSLEEALSIAREVGDPVFEASWQNNLGVVAFHLGNYAESKARHEAALDLSRELGDRKLECNNVGCLGDVAARLGDYAEAQAHFVEALDLARELGDRRVEVDQTGELGVLACELGDYKEARTRLTEALKIAREVGERISVDRWTGHLGIVAMSLGDYPEAEARLDEALRAARDIGARGGEGQWTGWLGVLAARENDLPKAQDRLEEALGIAREIGDRSNEGHWKLWLGVLAATRGDHSEATSHLRDVLDTTRVLGEQDSFLLEACADLLADLDRCQDAAELLAASEELNGRVGKTRDTWEQARYEAAFISCEQSLEEKSLKLACGRGRSLDWETAVEVALGSLRAT